MQIKVFPHKIKRKEKAHLKNQFLNNFFVGMKKKNVTKQFHKIIEKLIFVVFLEYIMHIKTIFENKCIFKEFKESLPYWDRQVIIQ